jgi:hypothetical protein
MMQSPDILSTTKDDGHEVQQVQSEIGNDIGINVYFLSSQLFISEKKYLLVNHFKINS